ncbi:acyl-homoserine-lactone synthase [Pseudorhodobacter sp.]|uniref:acyl-homoserine-lactone synthase n=1 Tax=Pseudorhodobacter sp. TaxID=1934400 RepID=UPI0026476F0C|nr:acyl-homoserine-lactone synthase [Pseudorhodobacter sp.]MDN5789123.1 GNAT family N-acetyltransferase [Pseudorhodobacter sp.]
MTDISIVSMRGPSTRWDLAHRFLELRRDVFIKEMDWQLHAHDGLEFEQYDVCGLATYVIAHDGDQVLGGARLLRCDTEIGSGDVRYSYMIRDATRGAIDLPPSLCWRTPPTDACSWELTRLLSVDRSPSTARLILDASNDFIQQQGGKQCLFLGGPAFMRMARSYGYVPTPLGSIVSNKDGKFLAFSCEVR